MPQKGGGGGVPGVGILVNRELHHGGLHWSVEYGAGSFLMLLRSACGNKVAFTTVGNEAVADSLFFSGFCGAK
jgi:hypothetical protein